METSVVAAQESVLMPLPNNICDYPIEIQESVKQYLHQMNEKERKAYGIAKEHLGTSFHIVKSVGYLEWKAKQKSS